MSHHIMQGGIHQAWLVLYRLKKKEKKNLEHIENDSENNCETLN